MLKQQRFVRYGHDATVCITLHVLLLSGISCTYFIFQCPCNLCLCLFIFIRRSWRILWYWILRIMVGLYTIVCSAMPTTVTKLNEKVWPQLFCTYRKFTAGSHPPTPPPRPLLNISKSVKLQTEPIGIHMRRGQWYQPTLL